MTNRKNLYPQYPIICFNHKNITRTTRTLSEVTLEEIVRSELIKNLYAFRYSHVGRIKSHALTEIGNGMQNSETKNVKVWIFDTFGLGRPP